MSACPVRCRYNALAKTLDGPRKYFCSEWRGLQNTAVSPRAGDSRGCWAGQREARVTRHVTRDNRDTCRRVHVTRGKVDITVLHCMIVAVSQCYRRAADLKIIIHFTAAEVEQCSAQCCTKQCTVCSAKVSTKYCYQPPPATPPCCWIHENSGKWPTFKYYFPPSNIFHKYLLLAAWLLFVMME